MRLCLVKKIKFSFALGPFSVVKTLTFRCLWYWWWWMQNENIWISYRNPSIWWRTALQNGFKHREVEIISLNNGCCFCCYILSCISWPQKFRLSSCLWIKLLHRFAYAKCALIIPVLDDLLFSVKFDLVEILEQIATHLKWNIVRCQGINVSAI